MTERAGQHEPARSEAATIDDTTVWEVATELLPDLITLLTTLLGEEWRFPPKMVAPRSGGGMLGRQTRARARFHFFRKTASPCSKARWSP